MLRLCAAVAAVLLGSCGGPVLDLGQNTPPDAGQPTRYATDGTDVGGGIPTIIATSQYGCAALALDETRVYWSTYGPGASDPAIAAESGVVRSCEKNNCAATVVTYAKGPSHVRHLVVDKTRVYWIGWPIDVDRSSIVACSVRGCDGPPTIIAADVRTDRFAIDDRYVYWLHTDAGLLRCPLQGCPVAPTLIASIEVPNGTDGPWSLVVDATYVYWITRASNGTSALGSLMAVPKDGSLPPRAVVADVHRPQELSAHRGSLVWTEATTVGNVRSCPLPDCAGGPFLLASRQQYAQSLAIGSEAAYWLASLDGVSLELGGSAGQLVECPIAGCGADPVVLATEQGSPRAVAVDATHVYWTTFGKRGIPTADFNGAVKRIRRRP
jgi:hypothetical protein